MTAEATQLHASNRQLCLLGEVRTGDVRSPTLARLLSMTTKQPTAADLAARILARAELDPAFTVNALAFLGLSPGLRRRRRRRAAPSAPVRKRDREHAERSERVNDYRRPWTWDQ